jgi:hypothetical protein
MASTPLLALSVSSAAGNAAVNGSSDSSASSPNSDSGTDPKRSNIGLIVGAVVGAVAGLALLGICGFCLMRRADRRVPHNRHTGGEDVLKEELLLEQVSRAPSPEGSHVVLVSIHVRAFGVACKSKKNTLAFQIQTPRSWAHTRR